MEKVVFVSTNRMLIEKTTAFVCSHSDIDIQLLSISDYKNAIHDIEMFGADIIIIDATDCAYIKEICSLCAGINKMKESKKYLFVGHNSIMHEKWKIQKEIFESYILCDMGLEELLEKLCELK